MGGKNRIYLSISISKVDRRSRGGLSFLRVNAQVVDVGFSGNLFKGAGGGERKEIRDCEINELTWLF